MPKTESIQENIQTKCPSLSRKPKLVLIIKDKRTCHVDDFAESADHGWKMNDCQNINKSVEAKGV